MRDVKKVLSVPKDHGQKLPFIFYDFFFLFDLPNDIVVKMKEDKKVNNEKKNCLFWAYTIKNNTFTFGCMVTPLGPWLVCI